jgi:hypothetical protein
MPRFVVLQHDSARAVHWDFLLETGEVLRTWALPQTPETGLELTCEALSDHRLVYLEYEGPIAGDRGSVSRWDRGTYQVREESPGRLVVDMQGQRLAGRVVLREMPDRPGMWRFCFVGRGAPEQAPGRVAEGEIPGEGCRMDW